MNSGIFEGLTFSILPFGTELASKRANLIANILKNQRGKFLELEHST
jgi:hypothetical protein